MKSSKSVFWWGLLFVIVNVAVIGGIVWYAIREKQRKEQTEELPTEWPDHSKIPDHDSM